MCHTGSYYKQNYFANLNYISSRDHPQAVGGQGLVWCGRAAKHAKAEGVGVCTQEKLKNISQNTI